ncbi:MAG: hypothetical protein J6X65_05750 [Bacteroidales bacterium]|nr:hypothetical protein [Bacteroidales bacterium]
MKHEITNQREDNMLGNNICAFCGHRVANKKNTHYLTDMIIRKCLNDEGCNTREKGSYYVISSHNNSVCYHYQREVSSKIIEEIIGRTTTDKENQQEGKIPFSVDDVFCSDCEKNIFTNIEKDFSNCILPKFRKSTPHQAKEVIISGTDISKLRLFFYIQLWRSCVCGKLSLPDSLQQKLHTFILNYKNPTDEIYDIPLSITYLETRKDEDYTGNIVTFGTTCNPYVIFMNDFVVQVYDSLENKHFCELYGINEESSFDQYINVGENEFRVKVVNDEKRKIIIENFMREQAEIFRYGLQDIFIRVSLYFFGHLPEPNQFDEFMIRINNKPIGIRYSKSEIVKELYNYFTGRVFVPSNFFVKF